MQTHDCDFISDEYITDKVKNQRRRQYSFNSQKYNKFIVQIRTFGKYKFI